MNGSPGFTENVEELFLVKLHQGTTGASSLFGVRDCAGVALWSVGGRGSRVPLCTYFWLIDYVSD